MRRRRKRGTANYEQVLDTVFVHLSHGDIAVLDAGDLPLVLPYKWYSRRPNPYAMVRCQGTTLYMHRLIMGLANGDRRKVDHINHDTLDNRRSNLRIATHRENLRNMRKVTPHSSRFKGVSLCKGSGRWHANAHLNYQKHFLGSFATEVEAAEAYDAFAIKHFGEYAKPNVA